MSKIEQIIDEIEEFIEGCKPAAFSQTKIVVPKDELYELLTELRLKTPEEIKRYQKIIAQKDKIINDAKAQSEQMIKETTDYCNALVDEHEIMLKAYEKAEQTINDANTQAEEIVSSANQNADEIRMSALKYTQDLITDIKSVVESSLDIAKKNSEGLIGGLSRNMETLVENNEALAAQISEYGSQAAAAAPEPAEQEEEEPAEEDKPEEATEDYSGDEQEEDGEEEPEDKGEKEEKPKFHLFSGRKAEEEDDDDIDDDEDFDDID